MRSNLKKILFAIRDFIERIIPVITFSILFLAFVYAVFARYVMNKPPAWGTEVQVASYMWTVLIGACYIRRIDKHVKFSMVYDALSPGGQRILRIFRNMVMGITYAILLFPTITYIKKYRTISPSLRVPVKYYFFPIIVLVFQVMCYSFADVYKDIKEWISGKKDDGKEEDR